MTIPEQVARSVLYMPKPDEKQENNSIDQFKTATSAQWNDAPPD